MTQLNLQLMVVLKEIEFWGGGVLLEEMGCWQQALWVTAYPHSGSVFCLFPEGRGNGISSHDATSYRELH